jgi:hypothetical protein
MNHPFEGVCPVPLFGDAFGAKVLTTLVQN